MDILPLVYPFIIDGHLRSFHLLTIVNTVAVNPCVYILVWTPAFSSFECMPRSGTAGLYGGWFCLIFCGTTGGFPTVGEQSYISTSSVWGLLFLYILNQKKMFLIIAVLVGVKWNFTVISICTSIMTDDVENLFQCLFAICTFSLEK